jgi:hypothetical protein
MSKRGIRRVYLRMSLAAAAVILAGGATAALVAVGADHGGTETAESAGFSQASGRTMSYTSALSSAVKDWSKSPSTSLTTISHMKPVTNYWSQSWHHAIIVIQRGTVVAVGKNEFTVKSANGTIKMWNVNGATKTKNVGGTATGMSAMTGGTMKAPSRWTVNTRVTRIAKGDLVFVYGERVGRTLKAQLVLFAARATTNRMPMATPTAKPTVTAPAPAPTGVGATITGTHF